jgi:hypothetical protein
MLVFWHGFLIVNVCGHFLQVDVPLTELEQEKAAIKTLTHPLDTVMDLSIGAGWPSGGSVDSRENAGQRTRQGSVDLRQVTELECIPTHAACAMWFAARGRGRLIQYCGDRSGELVPGGSEMYTTPARIVLVGIGVCLALAYWRGSVDIGHGATLFAHVGSENRGIINTATWEVLYVRARQVEESMKMCWRR